MYHLLILVLRIFIYADDMAIVGLLNHTTPDDFYFQAISDFSDWCKQSNLILNTNKTKEMVIDFSRSFSVESAVFIDSKEIKILKTMNQGFMLFTNLSLLIRLRSITQQILQPIIGIWTTLADQWQYLMIAWLLWVNHMQGPSNSKLPWLVYRLV